MPVETIAGEKHRQLKGKDSNEDRPPNGAYPITQTESKPHQLRSHTAARDDGSTDEPQQQETKASQSKCNPSQHPKTTKVKAKTKNKYIQSCVSKIIQTQKIDSRINTSKIKSIQY
jgi:hypothetical protein